MIKKISSFIDRHPLRSFGLLMNLVPLVGVIFYHWDPKGIFMVYCLETIIIGFFTILKMTAVGFAQEKHVFNDANEKIVYMPASGFILFFICHYGLFVAIQTGLFFSLSDIGGTGLFSGYKQLWIYLHNKQVLILLATFIGGYALSDFGVFLAEKAYKNEPMGLVMFSPYGRIFVQQFVVILGGFLLHFFNGAVFMVIFISVKIWVENYLRLDSRIREEFRKKLANK